MIQFINTKWRDKFLHSFNSFNSSFFRFKSIDDQQCDNHLCRKECNTHLTHTDNYMVNKKKILMMKMTKKLHTHTHINKRATSSKINGSFFFVGQCCCCCYTLIIVEQQQH